jgi:uncharacterized membrane protein
MRLWLIPVGYATAGLALGVGLPRLERTYFGSNGLDLAVASTPAFMTAVASGMMAFTGIVFAVTLVALHFTFAAYSPRLTMSLAADRGPFHAAGILAATFACALGTLAWVDPPGAAAIPPLSAAIVLFLLITSIATFSRLLQRLAGLRAGQMVARIGEAGRRAIATLREPGSGFPGRPETAGNAELGSLTQSVRYAGNPMIVAGFNAEALVRQAAQAGAVIEMVCGVGDSVVQGTRIAHIHGARRILPRTALQRALQLKPERTLEGDCGFAIRLLADVAIKALSPGVSDPATAVQVIDQMEDLLGRLAKHPLGSRHFHDSDGHLRLIVPMPSWDDYLALAFEEIQHHGAGSVQIVRRIRAALTSLSESLHSAKRLAAVARSLQQLDAAAQRRLHDPDELALSYETDRQGLGLARRR